MHGLGNDFVLIDTLDQHVKIEKSIISKLSNRNLGIGFDQLIVLSQSEYFDAEYRFFNPDGSEAEQCGNGQRCISHYLNLNRSKKTQEYSVTGKAGVIKSKFESEDLIKVSMGKVEIKEQLQIKNQIVYNVNLGNPHSVLVLKSIENACFKNLVNDLNVLDVNFEIVEVQSSSKLNIRVLERGTGETQACGSGACAVVAALAQDYDLSNEVKVTLPGGDLMVEYDVNSKAVWLSGPSRYVFNGFIQI